MKAKDNNNKLPEVQKKGLWAKIRKAMFIVVSSIGLTTLSTGVAKPQEVAKEVETESTIDEDKREHFAESLKVIVNNKNINERINENISEINERRNKKLNENMIDAVIEKRR